LATREIVLHIGFSKTGSSALQVFLSQNCDFFRKYNYDYPEIDTYHVEKARKGEISSGNGHLLVETLRADLKNSSYDRSTQLLAPFLQVEGGSSNLIISSESFGVMTEDEIAYFSGFLEQYPFLVKIVCYVRRQDQYIEAAWKQWRSKLSDTIQIDAIKGGINWRTRIDSWAKYFGKENILVRPYEKKQLPNGVIPDFLEILHLPWKDQIKNTGIDINPGFTQDVLEFRKINRGFYRNVHDNRLDEFLNDVLDDRFTKKMFEQYQILSPQERIDILSFCDADNQFIAREYLGRDDGRLFYEPWPAPDENWKPYDGLTLDGFIPIATQIEYSLYLKNQQLQNELLEVKSQVATLEEKILQLEGGKKPSTDGRPQAYKDPVSRIKNFFRFHREIRIIQQSQLFDKEYYLQQYPDVAKSGIEPVLHYVSSGWKEGRNPNATFSTTNYLVQHPDIAAQRFNPFVHYILEMKH